MKQILCRVLVLLVVVAAILGLSSCNIFIEQEPTFYDLVVKNFDREVIYGSELDFSGLEIEATTGDDVKYIPVTSTMIVSGDTKTVGAQELEIEYGGFSWTLAYEVFYKVEHIVDGFVYDSQLVSSRDEILFVKDPEKNGSIFLGWSEDMPETLTGNVRREAVFVDNITLPKLSATYGDTLGDITLPTVSGGKWHWQDSEETSVGNAGTNEFELVYVFDDTTKGELTFDVDVEVAKKHVDIKVLDEVFEYNGKVNTVRYELSEDVPVEDIICFGDIKGTEIGEYSYTIRIFNDNYEGQYSGSFEIKPIEITITVLLHDATDDSYKSNVIIDYGNSFPAYKVVVTDKNGNEYNLNADLVVTKPVLLRAGNHEITTAFNDEHYVTKIESATLIVNSVDLDPGDPVLIGAENLVYGDKLSGILFEEHQLGYWKWDLSGGDTVGNAGKNEFTAIFVPKDSSYNEYRKDLFINVSQKQLTFDITSSSTFVYSGKEYGLTFNVIDPNSREVVSGLKVIGNEKFVNAGKHEITLTFEDKNYLAIENTFIITIAQAATEKDFSFTVNDVWEYEIKLSDIPLPEGYQWDDQDVEIAEPGKYVYAATFYPDDQNYAPVNGSLTLLLDKATPIFTTDKKVYGPFTYNTKENILSGIINSTSNSDKNNDIEYYISGTDQKVTSLTNAGTYNIDVVLPESNKYKGAITSVVIVIDKNKPTIDDPVIDNWTYGNAAKTPVSGSNQVEIAGFNYYTEECGQYTKLDGVPTNAGTYYVTAYSIATDNYYAGESNYIKFEIEKAVVTRPTLAHDVYTGGTLSASVPASTLYKVAENGNPAIMNAGTYEVVLELLDFDNYIWNNGDKLTTKISYVIDKATINLSAIAGSSSFIYDNAFDFVSEKTYTTDHVTNFGEVVYLYATIDNPTVFTATVPENVGTYLVKAVVYADEANNWKAVETAPFRFEITQRPISVPALSATTSVFNGSVFKPTAEKNDQIYKIEYQNENSINKGEYKVTFTIIDQNYKWADGANGIRTYTITPATPEIYNVVSGGWTFDTPITHSASAKITSDGHEDYLINVANAVSVNYYDSNKEPINKPTNAGTYYVVFEVAGDATNGNWISTSSDYIEFKVEQFAIDAPELIGTGIYTFTGIDIYLTVKENDAHKVHYESSNYINKNVGSYTAVYKLESSNYKWNDGTTADKTIDYKIEQAGSSVTGLEITSWTFNDAAITPEYTVKTSTGYAIPEKHVSISFRKADSDTWTTISPSKWTTEGPHYAGDYYVKVSIGSDENNNWAISESAEILLNIAKDDYDMSGVSWNYTSPFTFNDSDHTVSVTGTLPSGVTVKEYTGNVEENAGTYTANVKFSYDSDNYNEPTLASLEWTINPQIVNKPEADTTKFVYNTTEQKYVLATHSGYTISGNLQTDAGTYEVVVTLNNTETVKNYIWDNKTYTAKTYDFVISPKALETSFVTLVGSLEYNSLPQTQNILVKFGDEELVLNTDYTVTGNVQTNAGENYELTVTAKEGSNYTGSVTIDYTVARKPISKPSAATGLAFNNGTLDSGIYTIEGQWTAVDTATAATVNGVTPAGDYKVTVTLNSNYKWDDGSTTPLELPYKIDKATIKLTNLTAQYPEGASSWTFGDTVKYIAYKADSSQTFGTIEYHYQKAGSTEWTDTVSGEGNYTVRASIPGDSNWYYVEIFTTFVLNKKVLTDNDVTHTYNNLVYTGSVIDGGVTVTVNGKTLEKDTDYTLSINKTVQNAGDYTITVTGRGNYTGTITKTFNVAKKALSEISTTHTYHNNDAEKTNLVYTGTTFGDRVVLKYGNIVLVKGTDYSISITEDGISADSVKNAGSYVVVVTAAENGNYSGTVTLTFSVDVKKVIAPEFAAGTNTILVYDHNATEANQPKLSDSADADYYGVTYPTFNKNVGTYEIVAALDAIYGDNIKWSDDTVANKTFTYSITEKGISNSDVSHTYNNLVYTGSEIGGTVTVVVNGKTLIEGTDYTLSIDKTVENAGDYIITVVGKGNYKGTVTKTFTVAPAQETVSFSKIAETAGSFANGTLTLTYTGEIDVRNFITATLKKSATAALTNRQPEITGYNISSAGEFTVSYKYAETADGNYAEVTGTVKVVINAVTNNNITLTANYVNGTEWRYEDAVKYSAIAAFGEIKLVYYKLVDGVYVEMEDFVPGVTILDHGDYKVVATIEGNNNYNGDEESIEFKVNKKIITDTAKNSTYDGNPHDSGLKDNDIYTVREHSEDNTNYGTYTVTATIRESKLNNYAWADDNNEASKEFKYQIATRANELKDYALLDKNGRPVTVWTHEDVISHTANVLHKADGDTLGYVVEYKAQADYSNDAILYTVGLPTNVGEYVIRFRTTDGNATIEYGTIQKVTIKAKNENAPVIAGKPYDNTDYETGLESNSVYTVSGTVTAKDAGTYTVVLTLVDFVNHKWTLPETVPANSTYTLSGDNNETLTIEYQIATKIVDVSYVEASKNEWIFDKYNATLTPTPAVTINGITFEYTYTFYMWNDATGKYDIPVEGADDISDIKNVGKYQVVVALVSAENNANGEKNYEAGDTASETFEIKQFVLDKVSLSETSREFNNAEFKPTVNNFNSKYCDTVVYAGADASFKNYGSYTATVSIKREYVGNVVLANNNSSSVTLDYSITSATPDIAGLVTGTWTFNENGTGVSHSATVTVLGATLTKGTHYYIVYYVKNELGQYVKYGSDGLTAPENAGTNYSVRVEVKAAENLNWAATNSEYVDFVIAPDTVNAPTVSASRPFNNGIQTSGWVPVDGKWTVVDTGVYATENGVTRAGNNYTATITLNSNYKWNTENKPDNVTIVGQVATVIYSITAVDIYTDSVEKDANYKDENGKNLYYTGNELGSLTLEFGGVTLKEGRDYIVSITRDGKPADDVKYAGRYVITVTGNGNYTGTHTFEEFIIDQQTVNVPKFTNANFNYTGSDIYGTYNSNPLYKVDKGNSVSAKYAGKEGYVIFTLENYENYKWGTTENLSGDHNENVKVTFVVTPKPVDKPKVAYKDAQGNIVGGFVYNAGNYTITITGVENYMTPDAGNVYTAQSANTYTVKYTLDRNYKWNDGDTKNYVELTWTIATDNTNEVNIFLGENVAENGKEWTYGDSIVYTASHKYGALDVTYINNETGEKAVFVNGTLPVGSYTASATLTVEGQHTNYNGGSDSVTFTVKAADSTVESIEMSDWVGENVTLTFDSTPSSTPTHTVTANGVSVTSGVKLYWASYSLVATVSDEVSDPYANLEWHEWTETNYPKDAGTYIVKVEVAADTNGNYNPTVKYFDAEEQLITISPKPVDAPTIDGEYVYSEVNGVAKSHEIKFNNYNEDYMSNDAVVQTKASSYKVTIKLVGTNHVWKEGTKVNADGDVELTWTISSANNNVGSLIADRPEDKTSWIYKDKVSYTASATYGTISIKYYRIVNGVETELKNFIPGETILDAGDYKVVATFETSTNWNNLEPITIEFNVEQIVADTTVINNEQEAVYNNKVLDVIDLPTNVTGGEWKLYKLNKGNYELVAADETVGMATNGAYSTNYYAKFVSNDNNYKSSDYVTIKVKVDKANTDITVPNANSDGYNIVLTYNGGNQLDAIKGAISISNSDNKPSPSWTFKNEDRVTVSEFKAVGTYTVYLTIGVTANFNESTYLNAIIIRINAPTADIGDISLGGWSNNPEYDSTSTIAKPNLPTVEANGVEVENGITMYFINWTGEGVPSADNANWVEWNDSNRPKNVGTYYVKVVVADDSDGNYIGNYRIYSESFEIKTKYISAPGFVDGANTSFIYGETFTQPKVTDSDYYIVTYPLDDSVTKPGEGTYKVYVSLNTEKHGTNIAWAAGTNLVNNKVELSYVITKKALADDNVKLAKGDEVLTEVNVTYDGAEHQHGVIVKVGETTLVKDTHYTVSYSTTSGNYKDVGTITVTVKGQGNYSGTITKTYTITPAPVTAPEIAGFEYNGYERVPELSDFTSETGKYKDAVVSITNEGGTNAGTYSVVIKIDGNHKWVDKYGKDLTTSGNYTLSEDGKTLTVSYEITPIGIEVSVTNNEILDTYKASEFTSASLIERIGVTITTEGNFTNNFKLVDANGNNCNVVNAGTYTLKVVSNDTNYRVINNVTVTVKIGQATPTVGEPTYSGVRYKNLLDEKYVVGGTASVAGSHAVSGPTINGGTATFKVVFNPTDTTNYKSVTKTCTVELKVVATSGETYYYSIEDALASVTSGEIWVVADKSGNIVITSNTEIKSGVTLILPYDSSNGRNVLNSDGKMEATIVDGYNLTSVANRNTFVKVAPGVKFTVTGTLELSGELDGGSGGGGFAGHTRGKYSELMLGNGAIVEVKGTIKSCGFITEENKNGGSQIHMNSGASLYQPFVLLDFNGGSYMYGSFKNVDENHGICPFQEFTFMNVQSKVIYDHGSFMYGYANLYANNQHNPTTTSIIGNSSSFLIQTVDGGRVESKFDPTTWVTDLDIYGGMTLNSLSLEISVGFTVKVSTADVFFPLSWLYDVSLNRTAEQATAKTIAKYTVNQKIQVMWGSKLLVAEGTELTVNGDMLIHDGDQFFVNYNQGNPVSQVYGDYNHKETPTVIVNGTLIADALSGKIRSEVNGAKVKADAGIDIDVWKVSVSGSGFFAKGSSSLVYNSKLRLLYGNGYSSSILGAAGMEMEYNKALDIWVGDKIYIAFDPNGGNLADVRVEAKVTNMSYTTPTISIDNPTRDYYTFGGWYYDRACTIQYEAGKTKSITDMTVYLYAKWIPIEYDVSYVDKSSTSTALPSGLPEHTGLTKITAETTGTIPTLSNIEGWYFLGWYLDTGFTQKVTSYEDIPLSTSGTTIYARWTDEPTYVVEIANTAYPDGSESGLQTSVNVSVAEYNAGTLEMFNDQFLNNKAVPYYISGWMLSDGTVVDNWNDVITENNFKGPYSITPIWGTKYIVTISGSNGLSSPNDLGVSGLTGFGDVDYVGTTYTGGFYTVDQIKALLGIGSANYTYVTSLDTNTGVSKYFSGWKIGDITYPNINDFATSAEVGSMITIEAVWDDKVKVTINYSGNKNITINSETVYIKPGASHTINTTNVATLDDYDNDETVSLYYGGFTITGAGNTVNGSTITIAANYTGTATASVVWYYKYAVNYSINCVIDGIKIPFIGEVGYNTTGTVTIKDGDGNTISTHTQSTSGNSGVKTVYLKAGESVSVTVSAQGYDGYKKYDGYVSYSCDLPYATATNKFAESATSTMSSISRSGTLTMSSTILTGAVVTAATITIGAN